MSRPNHIAFIMDGNNRWSVAQKLHFSEGHRQGLEVLSEILNACLDFNIPVVTLYAFSSENWKRPEEEKKVLFDLLLQYFNNRIEEVIKKQTKIKIIGDVNRFPKEISNVLIETEERSRGEDKHILQIALNYGGRDEIIQAVKKISQDVLDGNIGIDDIDHNCFQSYLYTANVPDPDLIVRTSGEQRISNFLIYQSAYAEYYFTKTLWPDFTVAELSQAIEIFSSRERRFGGRLKK